VVTKVGLTVLGLNLMLGLHMIQNWTAVFLLEGYGGALIISTLSRAPSSYQVISIFDY